MADNIITKRTNMKYKKAIDKLVPIAVIHADKKVPRNIYPDAESFSWAWNLAYHKKMDVLALEAGLRISIWQMEE